jgi:hypothetical protein
LRFHLWRIINFTEKFRHYPQGGGAAIGQDVNTGGDFIGRDQINVGKDLRDEQYQIVLNWDGKTRLRGFDLSGRDLSRLELPGGDLYAFIEFGFLMTSDNQIQVWLNAEDYPLQAIQVRMVDLHKFENLEWQEPMPEEEVKKQKQ